MIIDLTRFVTEEQPHWTRLETILRALAEDPTHTLTLQDAKSLHYLYQRASSDLARIDTFTAEPELRRYLESLVARAYMEIHETRSRSHRLAPLAWFFGTFPRAFRKHAAAFRLSVCATLLGMALGAFLLAVDPGAKQFLMPFPHLQIDPSERVRQEERDASETPGQPMGGAFSAMLMTHNIKVSVFVMALGMSFGVGTILVLFVNGVLLGAVAFDFFRAGEHVFLLGWLLPHGAIEIPSVLIAGQAGLVLASALIGSRDRRSTRERLRRISGDLMTLIGGVGVLLVWAGIVESFFSALHEPALPYALKIAFGAVELALLTLFLFRSGRREGGVVPVEAHSP